MLLLYLTKVSPLVRISHPHLECVLSPVDLVAVDSGDRTRYLGVYTVEFPAKETILPTHEDSGASDTRNYPTDLTAEWRNLVYKLYWNVVVHVWESNP